MSTDSDLSERGISAEKFDREYFLSEAGGKKRLVEAVRTGDFSRLLHTHVYQKAIELAHPKLTDRILDVGCGRGELAFMLAYRRVQVTGVDYSADSIQLCKELKGILPKRVQKKLSFKQANILDDHLDLEIEGYDLIFFLDVIEHLTALEGEKALQNIYRLLRPGGRLVIHTNNLLFEKVAYRVLAYFYHGLNAFTDFGKRSIQAAKTPYEHLHINYYSKRTLEKALKSAGFSAKVTYVQPENIDQVKALISPGKSLIRRPIPHLVWWLSKTPLIAVMSPSLWAVGEKR